MSSSLCYTVCWCCLHEEICRKLILKWKWPLHNAMSIEESWVSHYQKRAHKYSNLPYLWIIMFINQENALFSFKILPNFLRDVIVITTFGQSCPFLVPMKAETRRFGCECHIHFAYQNEETIITFCCCLKNAHCRSCLYWNHPLPRSTSAGVYNVVINLWYWSTCDCLLRSSTITV